jgi:tetratricopeptide (TPR) repeat protein
MSKMRAYYTILQAGNRQPEASRTVHEGKGSPLKNLLYLLALCVFLLPGSSGATDEATPKNPTALAVLVPGGGTYSRPISTNSPKAQSFFDQGLRFAWGFYFPESIASYQQASFHDPDHPMPYWGLAHALGPNPNSRYARMPDDPKGEGFKAITNARARIGNASPLEAELIGALWTFYDQDANPDAAERDRAYLASMRALNDKYPQDPDIAALYAASYMNIARWNYWDPAGKPQGETIPVAEALEKILATRLTHPGVMHLHIHLLEASTEPERALVSADNLERTMPIAGHIVHMPAHIYLRVGQFQRAIDQNVRSQAVDRQFAEIWGDHPLPDIGTYPLSHQIHAGHAIDFIRYAATVQGNYGVAIEAAERAKAIAVESGNLDRGQKRIAAPWLVHKTFGRWHELIESEPSHSGLPYLDGIWAYSLGSALLNTGDIAGAENQLARLREITEAPNADQHRAGPTPVSAILKLAAFNLAGEIMQANGDSEGAIEAFENAVALEDRNQYTEPPDWAQPARHYLGAALIQAGRYKEAEAVYRRDLQWNHNNGWSLFGLQQALQAQRKTAESQQVMNEYRKAWGYSDVELTGSHF